MDWFTGILNWLLGWFESSESKTVRLVREKAVELCGFLPTVETVLALIAVNNPAAMTAVIIAKKICVAVTAHKMGLLSGEKPPVVVDGVVIDGKFV